MFFKNAFLETITCNMDLGMLEFSNCVLLRILGCLNFQNVYVQDCWDVLMFKVCMFLCFLCVVFRVFDDCFVCLRILGCLDFQLCVFEDLGMFTLSKFMFVEHFGCPPSPLSPPPSVSDGPRFVSDGPRVVSDGPRLIYRPGGERGEKGDAQNAQKT